MIKTKCMIGDNKNVGGLKNINIWFLPNMLVFVKASENVRGSNGKWVQAGSSLPKLKSSNVIFHHYFRQLIAETAIFFVKDFLGNKHS